MAAFNNFRKPAINTTSPFPKGVATRTIPYAAIPAMFRELTPGEIKLLTVYMTTLGGTFAPSSKFVTNMTGLSSPAIYSARRKLIERGIVTLTDDHHCVFVNWDALIKLGMPYLQNKDGRLVAVNDAETNSDEIHDGGHHNG